MILYTIRVNCSDLLLKAVLILTIIFFFYLLLFGQITVNESQGFYVDLPRFSLNSRSFLLQYGFIIPFVCILGFSKTFIEVLQSAPLILSKPISRAEFLLKNYLGVFILVILFTIFVSVAFILLFFLKAGSIPFLFIKSLFFLPIGILALYSMVICISVFFESYALTVFTTFIYIGLQPMILTPDIAQFNFGIKNSMILKVLDSFLLMMPNIYGGIRLMMEYLTHEITFWGVSQVLLSVVPIMLLAIFKFKRKEF